MNSQSTPLVVQYLYVHEPDEAFDYPTARSGRSPGKLANRYLECALAQVASLRLRDTDCDLALATNASSRESLGAAGMKMLNQIESFGVEILPTPYRHRPGGGNATYVSSRYVFDAILAAVEGQPEERQLWFTDLDCVWVDPQKLFASAPAFPQIGCVLIDYPPDWDTVGFGDYGRSRTAIGELAAELADSAELAPALGVSGTLASGLGAGTPGGLPGWVGGELLTGTPEALRNLVATAERLDAWLAQDERFLPNEEQILSFVGAVGSVGFRDLSSVARRVLTGSRHGAPPVENPLSLGLWHLPNEKGLSLRRAARDVCRGRGERLRRDLLDPPRMGRRFNVTPTGRSRQLRDDGWIATQRISNGLRSALGGR